MAAFPPRLGAASPRTTPGARSLRLLAGSAIVLAGYLAGRVLFEQGSGWLAGRGVTAGSAVILSMPAYLGLVLGGIWAGLRVAAAPDEVTPALRLSSRVVRSSAAGLLIAALLVVAVYAAAVLGGWATLGRSSLTARLASSLVGYAILYAGIAVAEELVFRGALLGLLSRWRGAGLGVLASSGLFAAVHLAASATWARLLGVFLLGVLLAQLRLWARSLWPAIALHWTMHFLSYAAVLGLPPLRIVPTGPVGLIGRPDQLDAGLLMIVALALAVGGIHVLMRSAGAKALITVDPML